MNYTVQVNEVRTTNPESAVRAYASVTFEGAFKVCNIAILENRATGEPFISMPNYKTRRVDEKNQPQYQDICYPVTKEFREQLYGDILAEYREGSRNGRITTTERIPPEAVDAVKARQPV